MIIIKKVLVIGSLNMDFVVEVDNMPLPGQTILGNSFNLVPGGKGANQAYALGKLGTDVSIIGVIGNDQYGSILLNNLKSVDVNTNSVIKLENVDTGCAFINVDKNGENSIVVISGANKRITKEMINKNIHKIEEADIIVMQLEISLEIVTYIAKLAKKMNKIVILDPAPAITNLPEDLLKNIDIIKPNETEIEIISGIKTINNDNIISAAKKLIEKGVNNVIVTLGERGSVLVNKENIKFFDAIKVNVVDTTAAGDCFTAGLTKALIEGKDIDEAIKFGHIVSSIAVTKKGAQTSIPDQKEIQVFINKLEEINEKNNY